MQHYWHSPNRQNYGGCVAACNRRCCLIIAIKLVMGIVIAIVQQRIPFDLSKSMEYDDSYGNTIVLTLLKIDIW